MNSIPGVLGQRRMGSSRPTRFHRFLSDLEISGNDRLGDIGGRIGYFEESRKMSDMDEKGHHHRK